MSSENQDLTLTQWHRRRWLYYGSLGLLFAAIAFYFGPNVILFGKLTRLGYLNDLLCLPLFLPLILYIQHLVGLRPHTRPPHLWEVLQHWLVFSVVFEVVLPAFPRQFNTTSDPLDVLAYLVGGLAAWALWSIQAPRFAMSGRAAGRVAGQRTGRTPEAI